MSGAAKIETAVIIRTKNEEKWLGVVLGKLFEQTYKDFEVIIVDSGSTDKTLDIAKKFPVKIFEIPPQDFSYPYALNYGIERTKATSFVVLISAHSIPVSETWLEDGLKNLKEDKMGKLMGIYGFMKPLPESSFWDKFITNGFNFLRCLGKKQERLIIHNAGMGIMGFTNAIIRKELWEKRRFNEDYGAGGEDGEWADYWFKQGYSAIKDEKFTVFHSHNLSLWRWYKQREYWRSLGEPHPFKPLPFRKSATHKI